MSSSSVHDEGETFTLNHDVVDDPNMMNLDDCEPDDSTQNTDDNTNNIVTINDLHIPPTHLNFEKFFKVRKHLACILISTYPFFFSHFSISA